MSVDRLERYYLTWSYWARVYLLPAALLLICILLIAKFTANGHSEQDEVAVIAGFFTVYFVAIRGGHIYMIRTMHNQLKQDYAGIYPKRLQSLPETMKMRQIGFALARIKAELSRR